MSGIPAKDYFVVDGNAYWLMGEDWWSAPLVDDSCVDWNASGKLIVDSLSGEWLTKSRNAWGQIIDRYRETSQKSDLARFEQLVAHAFHAPIGVIDQTDIPNWWGVRFSIGGHDFIVFQSTDGSQDLGIDVTCGYRDGHEACENQFSILDDGYHYTGDSSDDVVTEFIRRSVIGFLRDGKMSGGKQYFPDMGHGND
jgi:hypothetical protein